MLQCETCRWLRFAEVSQVDTCLPSGASALACSGTHPRCILTQSKSGASRIRSSWTGSQDVPGTERAFQKRAIAFQQERMGTTAHRGHPRRNGRVAIEEDWTDAQGSMPCEARRFAHSDGAMFDAHRPTPLALGKRTTLPEHLLILCPTCHLRAHRKSRLDPFQLHQLQSWVASGRP